MASHDLGPYGITTNCFLPVSQSDAFSDPDSPGGKKYLAMMEQAIHYITNEWKESQIKIGAQAYLEKFYQSLGFKPVSEVYLEDDIPHLDMLYSKPVV